MRRNPTMAAGFVLLLVMCTLGIIAPLITGDAVTTHLIRRLDGLSSENWFGADHLGRDVYSRTIQGARISLIVGFTVATITSVVGMAIGLVSGYMPKVDNVVMRFMDGLMAFPTILLGLALIALLGASVQNVIIAIVVVDTPRMVRVVRGSVLSLREQAFVEAARALGTPTWRILLHHIAPNTIAPMTVQATYILALAILTEASLSFLGAGIPPTTPTWGNIMGEGRAYAQIAPWVTFFPGILLSLTVLSANLVGDGLRDNLDPRLRRRV
jgi:peptide/nickel transport system permease protein